MGSMKQISRVCLLSLLLLCTGMILHAQPGTQKEITDLMRSNGRIYVVIAVILVILIGIVLYLVRLDRKISKLEKQS